MKMNDYFEVKNSTYRANKKKIVSNVSFKIKKKGEIICFLGPSGIGKTTMLRTIAGLQNLESGEIFLNNKKISAPHYSLEPEKRNIALSFQDNCLFPHKNISENIYLGLKKNSHNKFKYDFSDLISIFQLNDLKEKYPHEISSGEAQRVSIARSLMSYPDLLLLDEPFSNIDISLRNDLQMRVKKIIKDNNITTIIVTHDSNEAFYLADKCAIFVNGMLKQFDTPYNTYHYPNSLEVVNFLKKGVTLKVKVLDQTKLRHGSLGIINGKFGCSNLDELVPGKTVRLLIQPDDLEHDDKSKLRLKIIDRKFRGTNFIYTLKTPKGELIPVLVESHHQHLHENNEEFGIKIPIIINHLVCF